MGKTLPITLTVEGNPIVSLNEYIGRPFAAQRVKKTWAELLLGAAMVAASEQGLRLDDLMAHGQPRQVELRLYFSTNRLRDPDNYFKALLDALVRAGLLADDNQEMCKTTLMILVDEAAPRTEVTMSKWEA